MATSVLQENISLKNFNTFGIDVRCKYFVEVTNVDELITLLDHPVCKELPLMTLGGGSNILFTKDFPGVILKNSFKGISVIKEDQDHVWLQAMGGEVWHDLVLYCIDHNYAGIENLSLIPGLVGAAPIQNIGAYGVEVKDVFESLEAVNLTNSKQQIFSYSDCNFGYRNSVFKNELKGKFIITSVILKLSKSPTLHLSYGAINTILEQMGVKDPTIKNVSDAIVSIRLSKLPDPAKIGNSGSFFKNPEINQAQFDRVKEQHPNIPSYPASNDQVKVPAGWLIEQCGWKGKRVGNTGSHANQALVLVNYGGATGTEVRDLAFQIKASVKEKFGLDLTPEVNIV